MAEPMIPTHSLPTWTRRLRWAFAAVGLIALIVLIAALPLKQGMDALNATVSAAGWWGPVIFFAAYVLATVLMIPGSPLTLGAGAVFGLAMGTLVVSLASTTGAALTFLITRTIARSKVENLARRHPKFEAVDRAIGEGGWKVVALLRLSPALPFNVQNYLYGLTAVRFWPCILASWVAMLPGTFMYVYLGFLAREGAEAASGSGSLGPVRWTLTAVGLAATIGVTVLIGRKAKQAISGQVNTPEAESKKEASSMEAQAAAPANPQIGATLMMGLLVLSLLGLAACARIAPDWIGRFFGPPSVELKEAYAAVEDAVGFDHSAFDALLSTHVDADGFVNYTGLNSESGKLDAYIETLAEAPFEELGRDEKLALLINAYNAFTLRLILDYWNGGDLKSIKDIPADKRWDDIRWNVAGNVWSLNQIEHEQVRPKFAEPRIHFALVCAAYSCPPLRTEAYTGAKLEEQLESQTIYAHNHDRWFEYDAAANTVKLTMLYNPSWYGGDFDQVADSVLDFASRYSGELRAALDEGRKPGIQWIDYSWALNVQP